MSLVGISEFRKVQMFDVRKSHGREVLKFLVPYNLVKFLSIRWFLNNLFVKILDVFWYVEVKDINVIVKLSLPTPVKEGAKIILRRFCYKVLT